MTSDVTANTRNEQREGGVADGASGEGRSAAGSIGWLDLTVPDAVSIRDFYAAVAGWRPEPMEMGGYSDFVMMSSETGAPVAGICHARGENADLPPRWLAYITVEDLDASVRHCIELGGAVVSGPKGGESSGRYCVIRDPAGAVAALMERPDAPGSPAP